MAIFLVFLAVALLLFGAWLSVLLLRQARPRSRERRVALVQVWRQWPEAGDEVERQRRGQLLLAVAPAHRDAVLADLLQLEARLADEAAPLRLLRAEMMDSIERRLLNQEILALPEAARAEIRAASPEPLPDDAEAQAYLAANELRLEILREYAARRFGDRAPDDWFAAYEHAARLRQRGIRNYLQRVLAGEHAGAAEDRQQAMNLVDGELRRRLLEVAPGTRFPGLAGP